MHELLFIYDAVLTRAFEKGCLPLVSGFMVELTCAMGKPMKSIFPNTKAEFPDSSRLLGYLSFWNVRSLVISVRPDTFICLHSWFRCSVCTFFFWWLAWCRNMGRSNSVQCKGLGIETLTMEVFFVLCFRVIKSYVKQA